MSRRSLQLRAGRRVATAIPKVSKASRRAFSALIAVELAALVFFMLAARGLWFWADEWDFLATRRAGSAADLIRAHAGSHLSTLPILVYRLLWWVVGLRAYWPYELMIVMLHLLGVSLLWLVMRRAQVRPWTATAVAVPMVLLGSGFEDIIWPFQITLVGSLVFGVGHLLLADHDGAFNRRDWLGLLCGLAAILCSAVGVVMAIVVGFATLLRRGWRPAFLHSVPLIGLYVVWLVTVARHDYRTAQRAHGTATASQAVHFVNGLIGNAFRALGQNPVVSVAFGILLISGLLVSLRSVGRREMRATAAASLGLLVGAVAFAVTTGVERATWAPPSQSRYLYAMVFMIVPALGIAVDALMRRGRVITIVVLVLLGATIPGNLRALTNYVDQQKGTQGLFRAMILTLPRIPSAGQAPDATIVHTGLAPCEITMGWLLDGAESGRIPRPARINAVEIANDELYLSLVVKPVCPHQPALPAPTPIVERCVQLAKPVAVRLTRGEVITLKRGDIRLTNESPSRTETYPMIIGATTASMRIVATAAISLRIEADNATNLAISRGFGGKFSRPTAQRYRAAPLVCIPTAKAL